MTFDVGSSITAFVELGIFDTKFGVSCAAGDGAGGCVVAAISAGSGADAGAGSVIGATTMGANAAVVIVGSGIMVLDIDSAATVVVGVGDLDDAGVGAHAETGTSRS